MIIRSRTVITLDGAPIENGAVAIAGNRIVDVGRSGDVRSRNTGDTLDLGEQLLLPGLINAHCHLDYTCLRGKIPAQKSFTDWIRGINANKSELSPKDYLVSINDGFAEAKRFGTTTIANLTAFPELISEIQPPIRTWWFPELIDVRAPERAIELVDSAVEALNQIRSWGLAPHALFTASRNLFRHCEDMRRNDKVLLTTHLAESREEMQMFRDATGPLYEFIKSIGRPMDDCGNKTPLELFLSASLNRSLSQWIVTHLNELTESDFGLLERADAKFHIAHCPRSHDYFGHTPFAFERLRSLGFNICLGTDSLASNESLSLFDEMRAFQKHFPSVSAEEIVQMATVNPARTFRQENAVGRIRPGFQADFIGVPCSGSRDVFDQIVAFDRPVAWMMIDGKCR